MSKTNYDPKAFFEYLGYFPASKPYSCVDQPGITVYCRGDRAQLEEFLEPTPFELVDDRFAVIVTDFTNNTNYPYFDSGVILAVRFAGHEGGNFYFEFENQNHSVASGREKWGYPKKYAHATLDYDEQEAKARVFLGDTEHMSLSVDLTKDADASAWDGLKLFPHLQVRAVPQFGGDGFESFRILSRDTSADFVTKSSHVGPAKVELGESISFRGSKLKVLDVLGGVFTIGDYYATAEATVPSVVADLVND